MTTLERFLDFSYRLTASLLERHDVLGLILVGSSADTSRVDEWSDHDFFVVTKPGSAESLRQDLSWLPDHEQIIVSPRETDHGLKVVYQNCHVLEFAVFDDAELELASANVYEVAIDRSDISARMAAIAKRSEPKPFDLESEFDIFLAHILIGVGRGRRGEHLIAGHFARTICLNAALGFVRALKAPVPGSEAKEDNLNRYRRFELQYPELGEELVGLQHLSAEDYSRALLNLVLSLLGDKASAKQLENANLVRRRFGWN